MADILVIDNYDSFTWNLVHYLMELGAEVEVVRNDAISAAQAVSSGARGFLISPGPCTPNEAGISLDLVGACAEAKRPLLGVCLGHQSIGQHFGGKVVRGGLMHGKTSPVSHDGTGLFAGLPSPFIATRYHSLIVEGAPQGLVVNATSEDGSVMGYRQDVCAGFGYQVEQLAKGSRPVRYEGINKNLPAALYQALVYYPGQHVHIYIAATYEGNYFFIPDNVQAVQDSGYGSCPGTFRDDLCPF